jgi:hypothetical protein
MYVCVDFVTSHILTNLEFLRQIFEKYSDIKCHLNPTNGDGRTYTQQTVMTKPIVALRDSANAPTRILTVQRGLVTRRAAVSELHRVPSLSDETEGDGKSACLRGWAIRLHSQNFHDSRQHFAVPK